ncbi:MAG: nickel-dependent hydrogenase large subunit [Coriobacteriia bacterium]
MARTVVDPLTRIEGHLRVEVEVTEGKVSDAWVSGTLWRGMELVLQDRHPEDAFWVSQRICGVCPISHSHASAQSTEQALGITIPNNARIIRNLIEAAQYLHSHILWFYTLTALDYVNPVNALSADIADTYALAHAAGTKVSDFGAVAKRLAAFVENGQLSIFTGHEGWWGVGAEKHPGYVLPPELDLIATAHYLEALELQAVASEIIAIMSGKFPHHMTSIPGGTAFVPTEQKLDDILFRFTRVKDFIDTALIPDTLAIAPYLLGAASFGGGCGNFLSWGVFEAESRVPEERYLPRGFIESAKGLKVDAVGPDDVTEYLAHSWYDDKNTGLKPAEGKTEAKYEEYSVDGKYSWGKAARCKDLPAEVGPLSRMLVGYLDGVKPVVDIIDFALGKLSEAAGATLPPTVLVSLLGRVAARNLEAAVVAQWSIEWVNELIGAIKGGDSSYFVTERGSDGKGAGLWEAPRGSVGHWMTVEGGKIANYQIVAPTTWDIAPRDDKGVLGPMEQALVGTPVVDAERPLEVLQVAHSFDP